ncbi:hypothetical protein BJ912DRAFT_1060183 [Pholiota molesta]|nr:hypothetical protein BJ912DRAFT_1060183 [Pholiota molesta]
MAITTEPGPATPSSPRSCRSRIPPDEYEEQKRMKAKLVACQLEQERQTRNAEAKAKHNRTVMGTFLNLNEAVNATQYNNRILHSTLPKSPKSGTTTPTANSEGHRQAHETTHTIPPTQGCRPRNYEDIKKQREMQPRCSSIMEIPPTNTTNRRSIRDRHNEDDQPRSTGSAHTIRGRIHQLQDRLTHCDNGRHPTFRTPRDTNDEQHQSTS